MGQLPTSRTTSFSVIARLAPLHHRCRKRCQFNPESFFDGMSSPTEAFGQALPRRYPYENTGRLGAQFGVTKVVISRVGSGRTCNKANLVGPPGLSIIQVFHKYLEKAMATLASENAVLAAALHKGGMTHQQTSEFSQQLHHSDSNGSFSSGLKGMYSARIAPSPGPLASRVWYSKP